MKKFFKLVYQILISLKLAVVVILTLAAVQAVATVIESVYSTKAAHYWVYGTVFFDGLLFLLGLNIFFVATSRYPWKRRHGPFLMAHVGILSLLFGSVLTQKTGVDGNLIASEGETASRIQFDSTVLSASKGHLVETVPIKWQAPLPSWMEWFAPLRKQRIRLKEFDLEVTDFIPHAEPIHDFEKWNPDSKTQRKVAPAVRFKLKGGPLPFSKKFWLWAGVAEWASLDFGPARFDMLPKGVPARQYAELPLTDRMGRFFFEPLADGGLKYYIVSKKGVRPGEVKPGKVKGTTIDLGWMGMQLEVLEFFPDSVNVSQYEPARNQKGNDAPPSAIRVASLSDPKNFIWLGANDRGEIRNESGEKIKLLYGFRQIALPFGIKLEKFQIDHYQGTKNPAEYSSKVRVSTGEKLSDETLISMNEPLHHGGFTFYQASYIPGNPRPTTSVFTVNKDPGRELKYFGSLLIVFGAIWLFASKYIKNKKKRTQ